VRGTPGIFLRSFCPYLSPETRLEAEKKTCDSTIQDCQNESLLMSGAIFECSNRVSLSLPASFLENGVNEKF